MSKLGNKIADEIQLPLLTMYDECIDDYEASSHFMNELHSKFAKTSMQIANRINSEDWPFTNKDGDSEMRPCRNDTERELISKVLWLEPEAKALKAAVDRQRVTIRVIEYRITLIEAAIAYDIKVSPRNPEFK